MKVTITETCGRCKRTAPLEVELTEASAIEEKEAKLAAMCESIRTNFENPSSEQMPDLVVYFKGRVYITPKICDVHCAETIRTTLDKVLFRPIDPTMRKPREKKLEKIADSKVKEKKSSKKDAAVSE